MLQGKKKEKKMASALEGLFLGSRDRCTSKSVIVIWLGCWGSSSKNLLVACRSQEGTRRNWHWRLVLKDEQVFARQGGEGRTLHVWKQHIQQHHGAVIRQRSWIWPTCGRDIWGGFGEMSCQENNILILAPKPYLPLKFSPSINITPNSGNCSQENLSPL